MTEKTWPDAPPRKTLRYGFIGAGGIAGAHLRELAKRDDVEVVAMADISEEAIAGAQGAVWHRVWV